MWGLLAVLSPKCNICCIPNTSTSSVCAIFGSSIILLPNQLSQLHIIVEYGLALNGAGIVLGMLYRHLDL